MHCPECGFVNAEGANYCQKCGAFLGEAETAGDTTEVYQVNESGDLKAVDLEEVTHEGATLVIRAGGGRSGEAFNVTGERMTIGPEEVRHVARLAELGVQDRELERLVRQLNRIVDYVAQLDRLSREVECRRSRVPGHEQPLSHEVR